MLTIANRFSLSRGKMLVFLDTLQTETAIARTLYVPSGLSEAEINAYLKKVIAPEAMPPQLPESVASSKTSAVLFWSPSRMYLVLPPFPIVESALNESCNSEPLRSQLKHDYRIVIVLVRLGAYAIGLCQGEGLVTSKVGTGLVHARHRQGGSSAARFRRHREKQIEYFLTRVCEHAREKIEPYLRNLDYVVYGGAWTTILLLQKQCPFLSKFDCPTLPPLLDIPDPRQAVLEATVRRVWSSHIIEWREERGKTMP